MTAKPDIPATIALAVLALCWLGFGVIVFIGKRGAAPGAAKREMKSHFGFLLQCAAYVICLAFHRAYFSPLARNSVIGDVVLSGIIVVLALASEWLCLQAARTLGKQWALEARVIPNHELVQRGPYAVVRNPIYLAMLGNLLATGLAVSRWEALVGGIMVFAIGTEVRIRSEERLLHEAFGPQFEDYARRVPAFLPRLP